MVHSPEIRLALSRREIVNRRMARTSGDKVFDLVDRADAAAGADGAAIKGGGSAGEFELARRGPILEKGVDEGSVENVAGAGGVRDVNVEGGLVEELAAVIRENTVVTKSRSSEPVRELSLYKLEGSRKIRFTGDAAGDIVAGDEVIDSRQ